MARFDEPKPGEWETWQAWLAERPAHVRAVAERFDPWSLYRLRTTGHRVMIMSFCEHWGRITVTVGVTAKFNRLLHERQVFGIDPADLEPCDLPRPDEPVGAMLTQAEVHANLEELEEIVRKGRAGDVDGSV